MTAADKSDTQFSLPNAHIARGAFVSLCTTSVISTRGLCVRRWKVVMANWARYRERERERLIYKEQRDPGRGWL